MLNIYIANIDTLPFDNSEAYLSLLSSERQRKIKNITNTQNRKLAISAGLLLNYGLAKQNIVSKDLIITYNSHGKPYFRDNPIHFNLSHSGQYVLCAISDIEVGADIQKMTTHYNLNIAKRFFHLDEYNYLANLPHDKQHGMFFRLWALKESYVKNLGTGLANTLNSFSIKTDSPSVCLSANNKKSSYSFYEYKINNYYIAICSKLIMPAVNLQWVDLREAL